MTINPVLLSVVIRLLVVGILLGLINRYVPMASSIKQLLNAVVVIYMVIWVLQVFGFLGPLGGITLLEADALEAPLPSTPTLAFMFHPFEAPVLRHFLARVQQHYAQRPGSFDLLYVNAEHASVLDRNPAFNRLFNGMVPMSPADHLADLAEIAEQKEYGSTGDEFCTIFRFTGQPPR